MNTHISQSKNDQARSAADNVSQSAMEPGQEHASPAPLQRVADASEQVNQMKRLQQMADNSPQARQAAQLQNMVNNGLRAAPAVMAPLQLKIVKDKLNVVGENHDESDLPTRRDKEKKIATDEAGGEYWTESEFDTGAWWSSEGDDPDLRARQRLATLREFVGYFIRDYGGYSAKESRVQKDHDGMYFNVTTSIDYEEQVRREARRSIDPKVADSLKFSAEIRRMMDLILKAKVDGADMKLPDKLLQHLKTQAEGITGQIGKESSDEISKKRSKYMAEQASGWRGNKKRGIWKIGQDHIKDILANAKIPQSNYEITSRSDFNTDYPDLPVGS